MEQKIEQSDKLLTSGQFSQCIDLLKDIWAEHPDPEVGWRLGRSFVVIVFFSQSKPEKSQCQIYYQEGLKVLNTCLEKCPEHAKCLTWYGILQDEMNSFEGLNKRLENAKQIKEYWTKSERIEPDYYITHNSLGIWHCILSELFLTQPDLVKSHNLNKEDFSFEKSLHHLLRCEELAPNQLALNLIHLAKVYAHLENRPKTKEFCEKVLNFPLNHYEAMEAKTQAKELLKKLGEPVQ